MFTKILNSFQPVTVLFVALTVLSGQSQAANLTRRALFQRAGAAACTSLLGTSAFAAILEPDTSILTDYKIRILMKRKGIEEMRRRVHATSSPELAEEFEAMLQRYSELLQRSASPPVSAADIRRNQLSSTEFEDLKDFAQRHLDEFRGRYMGATNVSQSAELKNSRQREQERAREIREVRHGDPENVDILKTLLEIRETLSLETLRRLSWQLQYPEDLILEVHMENSDYVDLLRYREALARIAHSPKASPQSQLLAGIWFYEVDTALRLKAVYKPRRAVLTSQ